MTIAPPRHAIEIPAEQVQLDGELTLPDAACGVVLFAHGTGSSRRSPRNLYVAEALHSHGLATLLFDLLTPSEHARQQNRFDIPLLAGRLLQAVAWAQSEPGTAGLRVALFGASTGAAAALHAAAQLGVDCVAAVVSRGGRPDLAGAKTLRAVRSPTLLIVGGQDDVVLDLNRAALELLPVAKELKIIPGATHLFEEPGALEQVATAAADWFLRYL